METIDLTHLENQTDALIDICSRLQQENETLRHKHVSLQREHYQLAQKVKHAEHKINSVLSKLRDMEEHYER